MPGEAMTSPYVLHGFDPSPYSMKIRAIDAVLEEAGCLTYLA